MLKSVIALNSFWMEEIVIVICFHNKIFVIVIEKKSTPLKDGAGKKYAFMF